MSEELITIHKKDYDDLEALCRQLAEACQKASSRFNRELKAEGPLGLDKDNLYICELGRDCTELESALEAAVKARIIT